MNKVVLLALIGTLAFATEGCTLFSKFADGEKELKENRAKPIPVKVNTAQAQPEKTEEEVFADLEEEQEVESLPEIAGLIPATDPDVRVRNSVRGRNDPFSVVTLNPRLEIEVEEEKPSASSNRDRNFNGRQNQANRNNLDLPPLNINVEPTLAQDVVISGMLEADGRTRLIVRAPEESSSRYVEVGQYLSNGQVLVKSINKNNFSSPMIVLEQSGVEVVKTIGRGELDAGDQTTSLPGVTPNSNWKSAVSLK